MRCKIYYNVSRLVLCVRAYLMNTCVSYDALWSTVFRRENSVLSYKIGLKLNICEKLLLRNCLLVFLYRFGLCWHFKLKSLHNRTVISLGVLCVSYFVAHNILLIATEKTHSHVHSFCKLKRMFDFTRCTTFNAIFFNQWTNWYLVCVTVTYF